MVWVIEGKFIWKWSEGKQKLVWVSGRFKLSRVRVTKGKITVNVWRKSRGNRFWFALAWGLSYGGFELSGVHCISSSSNLFETLAGLDTELFPTPLQFLNNLLINAGSPHIWCNKNTTLWRQGHHNCIKLYLNCCSSHTQINEHAWTWNICGTGKSSIKFGLPYND